MYKHDPKIRPKDPNFNNLRTYHRQLDAHHKQREWGIPTAND